MENILLILLLMVGLLLMIYLADFYIKGEKKKKTKKAEPKKIKVEEAKEEVQIPKQNVVYEANINLADELEKIIDTTEAIHDAAKTTRLNHSRIADYRRAKNYETFSYDIETYDNKEEDNLDFKGSGIELTKDEYKKIVALSNIDDKK